jgi:hypothetical protein
MTPEAWIVSSAKPVEDLAVQLFPLGVLHGDVTGAR